MSLWLCIIGIAVIAIALLAKHPFVLKYKKLLIAIGIVLVFWPFILALFGILVAIIVAIIIIALLIWLFKKVF